MDKTRSGQECCSLHGWIRCLGQTSGDYAVIIHSDMNCSNLVSKRISGPYPFDRFFCTNISDDDIIKGKGAEKLANCIDAVIEYSSPSDILVLDSCMTLIIGDDTRSVVKEKDGVKGVKIHHQNTSGLEFKDPLEVIDRAGCFILDTFRKHDRQDMNDEHEENLINILGFEQYLVGKGKISSDAHIFFEELKSVGIHVNAMISPLSSIEEWERSLKSKLNITFDKRVYGRLSRRYEDFGIDTLEVPFPAGVEGTGAFIRSISEMLDIDTQEQKEKLEQMERESTRILEKTKDMLKRKKIIYNIASSLEFTISNSAKEGLLLLDFFKRLGCDVKILVQGNPEKEHRDRVKRTLESIGIYDDFTLFGHCGDAYKFIDGDKDTIVYGSPLLREQAKMMGNKFLFYNDILPGFANMEKNISRLVD